MNQCQLIGRLTKDPEEQRTKDGGSMCKFNLAIDRPSRDGNKTTDFPRVVVFGRQAENCLKFLAKGRLAGVVGRVQTGSYTNQNGDTVYTTDIYAQHVYFLEWGEQKEGQGYRDERGDYHSGEIYQNDHQGYSVPQDQYDGMQQSFGGYTPSAGAGNYRR